MTTRREKRIHLDAAQCKAFAAQQLRGFGMGRRDKALVLTSDEWCAVRADMRKRKEPLGFDERRRPVWAGFPVEVLPAMEAR